ncbi:hypothetical protein SAMN04515620_1622 [Collimonas sp. OK607]|uniref:hypothetical protein n=1 Tax=Collimonas sp. OK607 TaxID=1798194 RepID=UPI0008E50FF1|nr:hypothetical protein [Collimonas sp. OK607]SFB39094.1 hypothetical protein SAMN04515620_1622 [Collimonas sp. OK607]
MKKQISRISPFQTAKVLALVYFAISVPVIALMSLFYALMPGPKAPLGVMFILPFLYLIFGFIFTAFNAWIYNLIAKWVGGIEFTVSEIENS